MIEGGGEERLKWLTLQVDLGVCQVADFPPEIFVEAHAARECLSKARLLHAQPEDAPEAAGVDYEVNEEVPSGMVAEALSLMAAGTVNIKLPDVLVSCLMPDAAFKAGSHQTHYAVSSQVTF